MLMSAGDSGSPAQSLGTLVSFGLAVVGTVVAFRVRDEVFSTSPAPISTPAGPDLAIERSLASRQRRAESVALSLRDPSLARDLRMGRPDLARDYDDGGLVDVNHVSEAILVSHLGLTAVQASTVIEVRERIGGFTSANELCVLADLPPRQLDAIRDRVVTL